MQKEKDTDSYKLLDTSWLRKQVEGHILFGLMWSKNKLLWIVVLSIFYLCIRGSAMHIPVSATPNYLLDIKHFFVLLFLAYLAYFSKYYRLALYWCATKVGFVFVSFIFILGGIINNLRDINGPLYLSLLGIIWFPSLEFFPKIMKYQKVLSIVRLCLTFFWVRMIG